MQTVTPESPSAAPFFSELGKSFDTRPMQKKWTSDEYYRLAEMGFFEGKRVELIEGEIIEMAPMGSPHATGIGLVAQVLGKAFEDGFHVRTQAPLDISDISQPEPDVVLVRGAIRDFALAHPKTVEIAVEVSDSTIRLDRNIKSALYAKRSITEYWILNLRERCLEVYRKPVEDPSLGFIYSEQIIVDENEAISPVANPDVIIQIADMLP